MAQRGWMSLVWAGVVAGVGLGLGGCQTNPATGQSQFIALSRDQEIALGSEAAPQFTDQFGGRVQNERLQQYVTDIGKRMAAETEADFPSLPWEFTLLDSPVINAFALPGGKVFITRGLAEKMSNEAQLAGVLGHEIGHVTGRHANNRIAQQLGLNAVIAGLGIAAGMSDEGSAFRQVGQFGIPALAVGGNVVLLKFGRDEESTSDYLGMRYMSKVGYDPRGQLQVMEILREASGAGGGPPEILSSHPMPETRINQIEELLRTDYASTQNNPNYQLFPDRFQREFLSVVRTLPPAKKPTAMRELDGAAALAAGHGPGTACPFCAGR